MGRALSLERRGRNALIRAAVKKRATEDATALGTADGRTGRALAASGCWRLAILAAAVIIVTAWPAGAALRVCNKTRYLLNFAVGYNSGADFATEGWWSVTPNTCATPIRGPLKGRYVYLYATDVDANDVLKGSVSMCVDKRKFQIFGIADCWRRGLLAVNFAEIDTLSSPDWTVFLNDAGR